MKTLSQKKKKSQCKHCDLRATVETHYVPTQLMGGGLRFLLVGEAPGSEEDQQALPFVGQSGRLLRKCVVRAFGTEREVGYGNVVRCRPTKGGGRYNRQPDDEELMRCVPYLERDIIELDPEIIIALGRTALRGLTGVDDKISKTRGQTYQIGLAGKTYNVLSTYHPAFILRSPAFKNRFIADLLKALPLKDLEAKSKKVPWKLLKTKKQVRKWVDHCLYSMDDRGIGLGLDTETVSWENPHNKPNKRYCTDVLTIQLSTPDRAAVIPVKHPQSPFRHKKGIRFIESEMQRLFTTPDPKFCRVLAHNASYDFGRLRQLKTLIRNAPVVCTMAAMHLLDENRLRNKAMYDGGPFKLDTLAEELLGEIKYEDREVHDCIACLDTVKLNKVAKYGASDAWLCVALFEKFIQMATDENFKKKFLLLCDNLVARSTIVLQDLEWTGFPIDKKSLRRLTDRKRSPLKKRIREITNRALPELPSIKEANRRIVKKASGGMGNLFYEPWAFNIKKRAHKIKLFFDVLELEGLNVQYDPKENIIPSMNAEFKKTYGEQIFKPKKKPKSWYIPAVDKKGVLLDGTYYRYPEVYLFRELENLRSMDQKFLTKTWKMLDRKSELYRGDHKDGRVRAGFSNTTTVTGRNSSFDPNNQQVPRSDTPVKKMVKNMYISPKGRWLVQVDFKGAEVRWWAICSRDKHLLKIFKKSERAARQYRKTPTEKLWKMKKMVGDVHRQNASIFFKVPIEDVPPDLRQQTKSLVFARIYGQSIRSFANALGMDYNEAKDLADRFDDKYQKGVRYLRWLEQSARDNGYSESLIGRRRRLRDEYESGDVKLIARADRLAVNSPIQSIASDANNMAAHELFWYIQDNELDWEIHNLVHDSCVISLPYTKSVNSLYRSLLKIEHFFTDGLVDLLEDNFGLSMPVGVEIDIELSYSRERGFGRWGSLVEWKGSKEHLRKIVKEAA